MKPVIDRKIDRDLTTQEMTALKMWLSLNTKNTEVLLEVAHLWGG